MFYISIRLAMAYLCVAVLCIYLSFLMFITCASFRQHFQSII